MIGSRQLPLALLAFLAVACGPMETDSTGTPLDAPGAILPSARSASGAGGLQLSSSTITAGANVTVTVSAGSGTVVYLGYPRALFAGPAFVRIPSGARSATFTLSSNPFLSVPATATLSAQTTSPSPASYLTQPITVVPAPSPPAGSPPQLASAVVGPAAVTSGSPSALLITLTAPAPAGGAAIQVAVPDDFFGADADVPAVVIVPAGATSVSAPIRTHLSSGAATIVTETVVASSFGGAFRGGLLTITAP